MSRLRLAVLTTLVKRLQNHPGDALAYARTLTTADPLSESGHAAVIRLLVREGRNKEALGHYEHASRLLEVELGVRPSAELEDARQTLRSTASATVAAKPPVRASGSPYLLAGRPNLNMSTGSRGLGRSFGRSG